MQAPGPGGFLVSGNSVPRGELADGDRTRASAYGFQSRHSALGLEVAFSQAPPGTAAQETSRPGSVGSDIRLPFPAVTACGQSRGNP